MVAVHDEGREQLRTWRKLATAPHALMCENHTLPLLQEINLEHVTFVAFPYVAQPMERIYGGWAKNSVGDILDAVMQALEVGRTRSSKKSADFLRAYPISTHSGSRIGSVNRANVRTIADSALSRMPSSTTFSCSSIPSHCSRA